MLTGDDRVRVQITDLGGAPARCRSAEVPDLEAKLEGLQRPRGWGLFLIENMVDETRETERRASTTRSSSSCAWREATMATT